MNTFSRCRRGAGAIIGAAFVLLIIISGYSLYVFQANTQSASQSVYAAMNKRDQEKASETLIYNTLEKTGNNLKINLTNASPLLLQVTYIGVFDKSVTPETQTYHSVSNLYLSPGSTLVYTSTFQVTSGNFAVQLITARGNLFSAKYPFSSGVTTVIENYVTNISTIAVTNYLTGTQGYIAGNYQSLDWALKNPSSKVTGFTWTHTWVVSHSDDIVWRFNVTNNGDTALTLNPLTSFQLLKVKTGDFTSFYIVYNTGTYPTPTISTYGGANTITIAPGEERCLYFAVKNSAGNPSSGAQAVNINSVTECAAFLLIYDNTFEYAQNLPFIAINST